MTIYESWKDINGYNGAYQINNNGRVRSLKNKQGIRKKPLILKQGFNIMGYRYILLHKKGKNKNHSIARLVASHFVKNPHNKPHVNHIDGIKTNNNYINLEWVTEAENSRHAVNMGLVKRGEEHSQPKLTNGFG
jgi:hypothetical protein